MELKILLIKSYDSVNRVLKEKFIALNAYCRKEEMSKSNNLSFHLRKVIEEQCKLKAKRRKEKIYIERAELNEIENRKSIKKINESQC